MTLFLGQASFGQLLIGPKMGIHVGQVKYDKESFQDQLDPDLRIGYNAGFGITFPVTEPVSLHVEVLLANKGKSINIPLESLKNTADYYYMEMPIMMRYKILPQEGIFVGIGPNLSYWLSGSGKISNIEETSEPIEYDISFASDGGATSMMTPQANRFQMGLLVSIGALLKAGEDRMLLAEIRLEMGHSHFAEPSGGTLESVEFFDNMESKHQLISFNLGYFWALHKKSAKKRSHTFKAKQRK